MKIRRIAIQKAIAPHLKNATEMVEKQLQLDPADVDTQRRVFRAVVAEACEKLLAAGLHPSLVAAQAFQAVVSTHQHRQKQAVELQQPFGLQPEAKA